ncbi:MAG: NlpC/P60 family protein [Armatimonadota bacterium]|nr:NlpC/P60 family protein [bacterium]
MKLSRVLFIIALISSSIAAQSDGLIYKVKKGDTLWDIAAKHHTTPSKIAKANGINENATLALGKALRIPSLKSSLRTGCAARAVQATGYTIHTRANDVCLRQGPSIGHERIDLLRKNTNAKVLAIEGKWVKVALEDGTIGYTHRSLMAIGSANDSDSSSSNPTVVADASSADNGLIRTALDCRGSRYMRGGTSRGGFDCSGFTRYVFARYGVVLPHSSAAQSRMGESVSRSELRSGDLVFFQTNRRGISHVGIYVDGGRFVHAATYGRGVRVDTLNSGYYNSRFRCARRVK